jgi:integrase
MTGQRGQVWKRGDKDWVARYREGGRDSRRVQRGGFPTKREAEEWRDARLRELRSGIVAAVTLNELVRDFLAQYDRSPSRVDVMTWALSQAQQRFGHVRVDRLNARDLGAWRLELPEPRRHQVFAAVRQVLEQAVRWKMLAENPAKLVSNPQPRRGEVSFFETWADAEKLAEELGDAGAIVIVGVGTGLMPQEWAALERRDVDLRDRVLTVRRFVVDGKASMLGKNDKRRRRVPLRGRVVEAIQELPPRLDTRLVFPGPRGGFLDLHNWRQRTWKPAVEAAGLDEALTPYSMRHTYAAWSIAAGVDIFTLSRRMGTSVEMIDRTYGHLLPAGEERERDLLDTWDSLGHGSGSDVAAGDGSGLDTLRTPEAGS